jgi:hypothetical protein
MVSQPTMRCTLALRPRLLGLTAVLLFFAACGQNEGGRCQVTSDCASGLICTGGLTGNGTCGPQGVVVTQNDAAPEKDADEDQPAMSEPEAGPDAAGTAVTLDGEAATLDTGVVDSGSLAPAAID